MNIPSYKSIKQYILILLSNKIFKSFSWLLILQIFNTLMPILTLPYITSILGASNYGFFSIALNIITYFQVVVEFGFAYTGTKKITLYEAEKNNNMISLTYNRIITARLLLFSICTIVTIILSECFISDYKLKKCLYVLLSMILGVTFQLNWLFQGKQDMKIITIINAISRFVSVIFIFGFIKHSEDVGLYSFFYALTFLIVGLLGNLYAIYKYNLTFKFASINDAFNEILDSWYVFTSQAMGRIFSNVNLTIIAFLCSSKIIGIYSAIYKIPYLLLMIYFPISQAIYPYISLKFSKSFIDGKNTLIKLSKMILSFYLLASIILCVNSRRIVLFVFEDEFVEYYFIIFPLTIWAIISIINNILGLQFLVASGHSKDYSISFFYSSVAGFIIYYVFGICFDFIGIISATVLNEAILTLLMIRRINKIVKLNETQNTS